MINELGKSPIQTVRMHLGEEIKVSFFDDFIFLNFC